jgi:hypothetical protein
MSPTTQSIWLRTDQPVVPVSPAVWDHLSEVEVALRTGVDATTDERHPGFYEIEIGDNWYYVHVPSRLRAVYLVAAQIRSGEKSSSLLPHQAAC